MTKKILVPLEGSYKEYDKFVSALKAEPVWNDLVFLVDPTLDVRQIEHGIALSTSSASVEPEHVTRVVTQWLRRGGYEGSFDRFCMVEFQQNWMILGDLVQARRELMHKFLVIAEQLQALDYDALLCGAVSQFFTRTVTLISKALGKSVHLYTQSLIPGREFIRVDNDEFACSALGHRMQDPAVTQNEADAVAEDILDQVVTGKKRGTYMGKLRRNFMEDLRIVASIRNRLTPRYINRHRLRYWLDRFFLRSLKARTWKKATQTDLPQGKFVFFPLHMPGEAQTLVRGYPFFDDIATLIQLSYMLPPDVLIVAKEHPGYEGWLPLDALRRIQLCPNIVLARSTISSHKIIAQCEGIVTINSSVWFEAFAFKKPTICLGRGVFTGHGVVNEATSLESLQKLLDRLLSSPTELLPPRDRVHHFVEALHATSIPGFFYGLIAGDTETFKGLISALLQDPPHIGAKHGHEHPPVIALSARR